MKHTQLALGLIAVAIASILIVLIVPNPIANAIGDTSPSHKYYFDEATGMYKVKAGGGGERITVTKYYPTNLEINVGDTVMWTNPTKVAEPHTVTFVKNPAQVAPLFAPYAISDPSQLVPLPPGSNSEPLLVPSQDGKGSVVIAVNARVYFPVIIDSAGKETTLAPNATYSMDGTEQYVNSGYLLPQGLGDEVPGSSEQFTVKFEKSGSYSYSCLFHPWMAGTITVK